MSLWPLLPVPGVTHPVEFGRDGVQTSIERGDGGLSHGIGATDLIAAETAALTAMSNAWT